jgi:medium-chain acyl-[acyl-carrier-protein] hydrolase
MFQNTPSLDRSVIRLFCVPHAGGGPSSFRGWSKDLAPEIEASVIQLPGRERRYREAPYQKLEVLVGDLADAILPCLSDGQRIAFFGNSLGGLIAFETLQEIYRRTGCEAVHLFVAAAGPPHLPPLLPPIGHLEDFEISRKISERYGGISPSIMGNEGLLAAVLPALRADFLMLETYERKAPRPLRCPITAFGGRFDRSLPPQKLAGWKEQTTSSFNAVFLDESHLFVQSSRKILTGYVRETLLPSSSSC